MRRRVAQEHACMWRAAQCLHTQDHLATTRTIISCRQNVQALLNLGVYRLSAEEEAIEEGENTRVLERLPYGCFSVVGDNNVDCCGRERGGGRRRARAGR